MKKAIALFCLLTVTLIAVPDYVILNVMGETISCGEWNCPPNNDLTTVGSMPNQIFSDEYDELWVVSSGESKIQKLQVGHSSASIIEEYNLPAGSNPYLMYRYGDTICTSLWVSGGIGIIDVNTDLVTTTDSFCLGPQGILINNDYIYVTAGNLDPISMIYDEGQLFRLNRMGEVIDFVNIGINPQQIIMGPDDNLHIVCTGDYFSVEGVVYIVSPTSLEVIDSVMLGGNPQRLALDQSTGKIYSATSIWGTSMSGRLLAYNGVSHDLIWSSGDFDNVLFGTGFSGLACRDDWVYIPSMDSSCVEIVHISSGSISDRMIFDTGYGPLDVAFIDNTGINDSKNIDDLEIKAYPNPFNSSVKFDSPSDCKISIYTLQGQLIATLNEPEYIWTPDKSLSSGNYLAKIESDREIKAQKLLYIK